MPRKFSEEDMVAVPRELIAAAYFSLAKLPISDQGGLTSVLQRYMRASMIGSEQSSDVLRDQFAAAALPACMGQIWVQVENVYETAAAAAYEYADAMMAARGKNMYTDVVPRAQEQVIGTGKDDWILWDGEQCPVKRDAIVDIKFGDGDIFTDVRAGKWYWGKVGKPNRGADIIAYRVVRS